MSKNNSSKTSLIVPRLQMDALGTDSAAEDLYKVDERSANRFLEETFLVMLANKYGAGMAEEDVQNVLSARAILSARFSSIAAEGNGTEENNLSKLPPKSPRTKSADFPFDADQLISVLLVRSKMILRVGVQKVNFIGTLAEVAAAANTFRRQSPYERAERHREAADNGIEQQQTKQQQMFLADHFNHRWFSQQQIGERRSNDDVGVVRRCQTEQLSFGEEDAPRTGGSSAGNEIASRLYRHSAGAYRFDQQAPKGGRKAMEEFDYSWGRDSGGMEDQWQPKNSVSRGNAIAAYCRSGTPLCHLNATQNRSTTSRPGGLAEASSRPERGGSEGPSIKGLATEGQLRRRSSLGRVEQQYTRARAVNNGDFELAKLFQNYAPIDGGDNAVHFFPEEKSSAFLVGEKTLHGERELQDELEKLFEQLGLLEQPQLMANGDWKGLFASMQKRFGSLEEETQKRQNQEDLRKSFCFATNGAQNPERKQNVCTKPRRDILLGRCASSNSLAGREFEPTKSSHLLSNGGERRRPSLHQQQQQQKCGGDLSNFWLTMVKARAETSSQRQKLSLGLSAAEKLQSICQPAADGQRQKQKADESNQPISNYPYRKYGGVIETVAMRRNNYLMEAARTSSPSGTSTPTTNSGRATPNLRAFKSPSPSLVDQPNADFLDFGTPSAKDLNREKENRKGCGRFPTANEEEKGKSMESSADQHVTVGLSTNRLGILENGHVKTKARLRKSLSPDNISDCSQHSQTSAKPTTLPQPIPKHNLRDKLINAGFPVSRQSTSFFGGNANNPFYGQKQTVHRHQQQQQQHQQQPQHQQQQHQQNSSPNFPLTNTVISRVSLFEKQQNSPDSASVLQSSHHSQHSSEAKRQHLDIVNGPSGNGQLSPRSDPSTKQKEIAAGKWERVITWPRNTLAGREQLVLVVGKSE
uniref:Uncharacterized protein n=1 Tax=Globodera pallida TaxID=36090 RepID=A0A183BI03_GLOPA